MRVAKSLLSVGDFTSLTPMCARLQACCKPISYLPSTIDIPNAYFACINPSSYNTVLYINKA